MKRIYECYMIYKCMMCDYFIKWNKVFSEYLKEEYFKGFLFRCSECDFTGKKFYVLMLYRIKYGEDRFYVCDFCD